MPAIFPMWLHRFAVLVAASTVVLIVAGGLVTSTGSGLSVPDWPTTYGWSMFTFPLDKMVGGIVYEHGHRLVATSVGMLTIALAVWLWVSDDRRWLRRLGALALAAVCAQGLLGALTVRFFLPPPVSIAHAGLAEVFLCLTVAIAVFTGPTWRGWSRDDRGHARHRNHDERLRRLTALTTGAIYVQILVGATMRHTGAGLAIPDFPLVFGGLWPPEWTLPIAVHYTHRAGALVVATLLVTTAGHIWRHHRDRPALLRPATLTLPLVAIQIALGGLTVLTARMVTFNTAHVVTGAVLLATSLVLALRAWREAFDSSPTEVPA